MAKLPIGIKNNEKELYYAIKAFERVDAISETLYSNSPISLATQNVDYNTADNSLQPSLNGYFMRDDVPLDFISSDPTRFDNGTFCPSTYTSTYTSNRNKLGIDAIGIDPVTTNSTPITISDKTSIIYGPLYYSTSSYQSFWSPHVDLDPGNINEPHLPIVDYPYGREHFEGEYKKDGGIFGLSEESQDQAIRLLLGFKTIVSSIPDHDFQIDLDGDGIFETTMNFNIQARRHSTNIIGRMVGFLKGTVLGEDQTVFFPSTGTLGYWTIQNPRLQMPYGGFMLGFTVPIMRLSSTLFTIHNDLGITDPMYAWEFTAPNPALQAFWDSGLSPSNVKNGKMTFYCNILSNSGGGLSSVEDYLFDKTSLQQWQTYFIPLYDYLNGLSENGSDKSQYSYITAKQVLLQAPCIGPYNFGKTPNYRTSQMVSNGIPQRWCTDFMFDQNIERSFFGYIVKENEDNGNLTNEYTEGYFPGMDFMLLHNVYYAGTTDTKPLYHDLINRLIDYPINSSNSDNLEHSSVDHQLIGAFETMKVKNSLTTADSEMEVKASESITLLPGSTLIVNGLGNFDLHIGKLKCADDVSTNPTTGYRNAECSTCDIDNGVGENFAPMVNHKIESYKNDDQISWNHSGKNKLSNSASQVLIYPNPFDNEISINSTLSYDKIRIVDLAGKTLIEENKLLNVINVEGLLTGMYMIQLFSHDNLIHTEKIIKK